MSKLILEGLFESKLRVKILKYLFRNSSAVFGLRELAEHVQGRPGEVRREVERLREIGLIKIKK